MTGHDIDEPAETGTGTETAVGARIQPAPTANTEPGPDTGANLGFLPAGIAALTVLVVGVALDATAATIGALIAVGGLAAGLSLLSSRSLVDRTLGSCVFVAGFALAGGVLLTGQPVAVGGVLAVGATAATVSSSAGSYAAVSRTLRDSAILGVAVGLPLVAISEGVFGTMATGVQLLGAALTLSASAGALSFVLLLVVTVVLLDIASPVLEPRLPAGVSLPSIVSFVRWALDLPKGVIYVVGVLAFLLLSVDLSAAFEGALAALGPVGTVVELALRSGLLHVPVALVATAVTAVLVGTAMKPLVWSWLGSYPLRTLALASGGGVVAAVLVVATVAVPDVVLPRYPWAFLGALVLASFFVAAAEAVTWVLEDTRVERYGLALGSIALFATVTIGALEGLEPLVVFAGVAASILVWDLGENALTMRRHLGDAVDTRESELVHATGSMAVGGLGVAIAAGAMYVLGNVSPPGERWQALAPLVLALVAVFVLGLAVQRDFGAGAVLARARTWNLSRLLARYPFVVGISTIVLACLALIVLGYGFLVFFLLVFVVPFALLFMIDWSAGSPHDHQL